MNLLGNGTSHVQKLAQAQAACQLNSCPPELVRDPATLRRRTFAGPFLISEVAYNRQLQQQALDPL